MRSPYPLYYCIRPEMMINMMIGPPSRTANIIATTTALPSMCDIDFLLAAIELLRMRGIGLNAGFHLGDFHRTEFEFEFGRFVERDIFL